ncbi:uncharacterized protein LOC121366757 [Gigantopelta aegis]|uniref:uncharacterized protein LOC121366757 n=1 Tax=Gigantopelta aegis TaxID=1735272 RepID=UPI001B889C17|nr:uncharacterized protein LOC121366757 [Gigantopelta aegis]
MYRNTSVKIMFEVQCKAECASLTTPEDVEVLTVTEGKDKTFTCRIGGASPEPEVKLRLNGTSTTDPSVRKVSTSVASQSGETLCRPRKYDRYSPLTTTQFGYSPDRRHDGKFVYCSARNSKMGINDEVTSNKIRLIVQYGPIGKDIAFKPDGAFYTVQESESVTVTCFTDCNPSCTYAWAYQDKVIVYGSRLFLPAATRLEAGYYKCTARNPGNGVTAERFLKLRVQYGSLSTGAAIGIGLAAGVVVASVVAVLICCVVRRKTQRRNRKRSDSEKHT